VKNARKVPESADSMTMKRIKTKMCGIEGLVSKSKCVHPGYEK
jgi:hypothetical protein